MFSRPSSLPPPYTAVAPSSSAAIPSSNPAQAPSHRRASSKPDQPPHPAIANTGAAASSTTLSRHDSNTDASPKPVASATTTPPHPTSLLHPRVAVALGIPSSWHPALFACRLLSVGPAIWWSLPIALRLILQLHALLVAYAAQHGVAIGGVGGAGVGVVAGLGVGYGVSAPEPPASKMTFEARLKLTETGLAMIWCGCSAYLSFYFTDCLMSRWLVNYTPQATIVRLLAISALNGYLTSWVLYLSGSPSDPRMLLPAWIGIATILTALYHLTQRKINIRKETSTSISVFSMASFLSMVSLLAQLHSNRTDYPDIPIFSLAARAAALLARVADNLLDLTNVTKDL